MAPTASCSFYGFSKKKFGPEQDLIGALLIATKIREKRQQQFISPSYRNLIISRLRKNDEKIYDNFKTSCPQISYGNLPLLELTYKIGINIWRQESAMDVPILVRESAMVPCRDDLNLLSKTFSDDNKNLRLLFYGFLFCLLNCFLVGYVLSMTSMSTN